MRFGAVFWALTVVLALGACNKATTKDSLDQPKKPSEKAMGATYPHEKGFVLNHGALYAGNKEQCLGCHGKDGSGGTAKVACLDCHQGFPHPTNWALPEQHSAQFLKGPGSCARCHGEDWQGGTSKVSCMDCHQNFPHARGFAAPEKHGKSFVALKDKKQCLKCHDPAKTASAATRCDGCHKAFPHDSKFVNGDKVHKALAMKYEGKCLSCHRDYKENMPNYQDESEGIGCRGCHEGNIEIHWLVPPEKPAAGAPVSLKLKTRTRVPSNTKPSP